MRAEFSKGWWLVAWTAVTVGAFAALVLAVHGPDQRGVAGGRVRRRRRRVWLAACAAAAMSSACLTTRRNASTECPPDAEAHCRAECGRPDVASSDTHEGRCETILSDLCRAHCLEACGDHTPSLTKKIEGYESSLEHDCGSGQPVGPGEMHPPPVPPTPHPLDRLLRDA